MMVWFKNGVKSGEKWGIVGNMKKTQQFALESIKF
jgi:hypothetical protein